MRLVMDVLQIDYLGKITFAIFWIRLIKKMIIINNTGNVLKLKIGKLINKYVINMSNM